MITLTGTGLWGCFASWQVTSKSSSTFTFQGCVLHREGRCTERVFLWRKMISVRNLLMFFFSEGSGPQKDSCNIKVWKQPRVTVHYKAISHIYHEPLATFHQLNLIYKRTMSPTYWKWHFLARVVDLTTYNLQLKAQTFIFSQFKQRTS